MILGDLGRNQSFGLSSASVFRCPDAGLPPPPNMDPVIHFPLGGASGEAPVTRRGPCLVVWADGGGLPSCGLLPRGIPRGPVGGRLPRRGRWFHGVSEWEKTRSSERVSQLWRRSCLRPLPAQVPAKRAELVPVSLELGFELHHAEKAYIMLNT